MNEQPQNYPTPPPEANPPQVNNVPPAIIPVAAFEPATIPKPPQEPSPKSDKSGLLRKRALIPWVLFAIVLIASSIVIIVLNSQSETLNNKLTSTDQQLKSTQTLLDISDKNAANAQKAMDKNIASNPVKTDEQSIADTALAWQQGQVINSGKTLTVTIVKKKLPFAQVYVSNGSSDSTSSTQTCMLKQVNGVWVIITCGLGDPDKFVLKNWGVPDDF
ncbi:MAG: hypothetical protein ABI397_01210 [Candidatus Saccharimonas sp.]